MQTNINANAIADANQAADQPRAVIQLDVDNNEQASDDADDQLQTNINANATADANQVAADSTARAAIQLDVDNNEQASDDADDQLQITSTQTLLLTLTKLLRTQLHALRFSWM